MVIDVFIKSVKGKDKKLEIERYPCRPQGKRAK
jgi:hypothetical protein